MTKFAKLLIRICLGVVVFGVVSSALVFVSLIAMLYDKRLVHTATESL